ncbi:hypothetical protein [Paenibacillus xylanexedens]|uniref:hypothetical protein n=1 Tax=Paenibacillus xylanexedens TaxID=528191 RepID=UPI000FA13385|nr:hypothetical protein [Paenibacillus xylanexedens]RPK29526.1 hypothetical protein EDO6_00149 [Paenibacillus xylanexedens]
MSSPIEMIKAYHSLKSYLTQVDQEKLAAKLGLTATDLEVRLRGKDEEIEFILMLHLLNSCEELVGFEEGISALTNTNTPDLLVKLQDGRRIFIEIKSTNDSKYKIARNDFNRRVKFAESFGFPLYFAIKIKGLWMMFESDYLKSRNFKIDVSNYKYSILDEITGNRSFMFPKGLKIISYYSKTDESNLGVVFDPHGKLIRYNFMYHNNLIFSVDNSSKKNLGNIFLLEALQDAMSVQKQDIKFINKDVTCINEEFVQDLTLIDSRSLVQAPIKHIIHENGFITDLNSYFRDIASTKKTLFSIDIFHELVHQLIGIGVPILEKKGEFLYSFKINDNES